MEPVLTAAQMRAADQATIAAGTPELVLMERAAHACAVVAERMLGGAYGKRVVAVCGKGNNGGDGVLCAEQLRARGAHATVVRTSEWSASNFERAARRADLVIDAVLGTGSSGPPRDAASEAIGAIASTSTPVLSVDIPSGVDASDGSVSDRAVRADVTVAIQALKVGHVVVPGSLCCGRIDVADIGIGVHETTAFVPTARDVRAVLPGERGETHKYDVGALGLLAGSRGMAGAAALAANGAIRAGAGLVVAGLAGSVVDVFQRHVAEAVSVALPERDGSLCPSSLEAFGDRLGRCRAVAVGPGLGRADGIVDLVRGVLDLDLPVIVDGDGLWALAQILRSDPDAVRRRNRATVLTPHTGEYATLRGEPADDGRLETLRSDAGRWGAVVHLKGRRPLTATPDGDVWVNPTGNPGAATGGTGDVLTGIIGALLAQGVQAPAAAWAGAYLHGAAADIVAGRRGRTALAAGDLPGALGDVLLAVGRATHPSRTLRTVMR